MKGKSFHRQLRIKIYIEALRVSIRQIRLPVQTDLAALSLSTLEYLKATLKRKREEKSDTDRTLLVCTQE